MILDDLIRVDPNSGVAYTGGGAPVRRMRPLRFATPAQVLLDIYGTHIMAQPPTALDAERWHVMPDSGGLIFADAYTRHPGATGGALAKAEASAGQSADQLRRLLENANADYWRIMGGVGI